MPLTPNINLKLYHDSGCYLVAKHFKTGPSHIRNHFPSHQHFSRFLSSPPGFSGQQPADNVISGTAIRTTIFFSSRTESFRFKFSYNISECWEGMVWGSSQRPADIISHTYAYTQYLAIMCEDFWLLARLASNVLTLTCDDIVRCHGPVDGKPVSAQEERLCSETKRALPHTQMLFHNLAHAPTDCPLYPRIPSFASNQSNLNVY